VPSSRLIGTFVAGLIIGLLVAWAWFDLRGNGSGRPSATGTSSDEFVITQTAGQNTGTATTGTGSTGSSQTGTPATASVATVSVSGDQKAGSAVTGVTVSTKEPIWAIVYSNPDRTGQVMGAVRFAAGRTGTIELVHPIVSGKTYYIGLAKDTADRKYHQPMTPLSGADGKQIMTQFTVK
jgi:hypothetical protein